NAQVLEALLRVLADVVRRKHVGKGIGRPSGEAEVFRRNFGGDVDPVAGGRFLQQPAEQPFAVARPVDPRRVEEVAPEIARELQRAQRLVVVRSRPAADAPHAVADFRDAPPEAAERAVLHPVNGQPLPFDMAARKSELLFVFPILDSSSSIASTGDSGVRTLRSTQTRFRSSFGISSSSFLVPLFWMSID